MRVVLAGISIILLSVAASTAAHAQPAEGLEPSFGNGLLTVAGSGFKPGEQITLSVRIAGATQQFNTTADARGRFRLDTGLAVQPGASVALEARGDQGTTLAAITTAPGGLPGAPPKTGSPAPAVIPAIDPPRQLPPTGDASTAQATLAIIASGVLLVATGLLLTTRRPEGRLDPPGPMQEEHRHQPGKNE